MQSLALVCNLLVHDEAAQADFGSLNLGMPGGPMGGIALGGTPTQAPFVLLTLLAADGGTMGPSGKPNEPRWKLPLRLRVNAASALRNALAVEHTCEKFCTEGGTGQRFPLALDGVVSTSTAAVGSGGVREAASKGSARQYAAKMGRRRASLNNSASTGHVIAAARPGLTLTLPVETQFQQGSGPQWLLHVIRTLVRECGCAAGRVSDADSFRHAADLLEPLLAAMLNLSLVSAECRSVLLEANAAEAVTEVLAAMVPGGRRAQSKTKSLAAFGLGGGSKAAAVADEACSELAVLAAGTLEHLSRQSAAAQQSLVPAAPELVAMLSDTAERDGWARRAGFALWSLVVENPPCQESVVAAGALAPLVAALKAPDVEVRSAAAGALWNLASLDTAAEGIMQLGALPHLRGIVDAGAENDRDRAPSGHRNNPSAGHRPRARSGATNDAYLTGDAAARRRAMKYAKVRVSEQCQCLLACLRA